MVSIGPGGNGGSPLLRPWIRPSLAVLSGLALVASFPPIGFGWLAILALLPLLVALRLPGDSRTSAVRLSGEMIQKPIRRQLGVRRTRFATVEELHELTGLVPGAVPPFGEPILPFELYADESVGVVTDKVAFNAGSLTNSIIMAASDWEKLARPNRFRFAKD